VTKPGGRSNWRDRGLLFDRAPGEYHDARPGYPPDVFRLLRDRCGLRPGARVLEVGAGSGQATMPMLEIGAHVTAVEPGAALADRLRERAGGMDLQIIVSKLEDAVVPETGFDLVVSATAFHWVDPRVGLTKCGAALRDGGWLALWWTVFADHDRPDPFHDALQPILEAKAPQLISEGGAALPYALDVSARSAEIESTGLYGAVHHELVPWEGRHEPSEIRRLFSTFSPWLALPDAQRAELLDDIERLARHTFGGLVVRPYQTAIYVAQRRAR
jgi:SAM-dependent methyltransferase